MVIGIAPQHPSHQARATRVLISLGAFGGALTCVLLFSLGRGMVALMLVAAPLAFALLVRWPTLGFYAVVGGALAIDVYTLNDLGMVTSAIPFWSAFNTFSGIPLRIFPAELLMLGALGLLVIRRAHSGVWPLVRGGRLLWPCVALAVALGHGLLRGMTHQDLQLSHPFNLPAAIAEIRGFAYVLLMYILGHTVIQSPRHVRTFTWVVITATGLTALQTSWIVARLGAQVFSLNEVTAHEYSIYWAGLILLTVTLWLYRTSVHQRWMALVLLPPSLLALAANQRRTAYVALAIALLIGWTNVLTDHRLRLRVLRTSLVLGLVVVAYGAAMWRAPESPLSAPVYAFRSIFEPDEADFWSNRWREIENIDIEYTIRRSPLLGFGFGQQYFLWVELPSIELYALSFVYWSYITHNAIYWLWIKLGAIGFVIFWHLICSALVLGCLTFRRLEDGELKAATLLAVGLIAMLMIYAYADLGLTSPKNMALLGALLGLLASLDRLATAPPEQDQPTFSLAKEDSWRP